MKSNIQLLTTIAPDIVEVMQARFTILRNIDWMAPVGRRTLAAKLALTERVLRTETDFLRQQNLIDISKSGMSLTDKGKDVLLGLSNVMSQFEGTELKGEKLAQLFDIKRCIIVPGDSDEEQQVKASFGQIVSLVLQDYLPAGENIIAVMGGTTMACVAENLQISNSSKQQFTFVPARGGVGEAVDIQANAVSSLMAKKTGGITRPLYVPEQVSAETYRSLLQEPTVLEVLDLIKQANCVIHSIGRALHMAIRRGMSEEELVMLKNKRAVAESFGYFFDKDGEIIYKIPRIGLQMKDLGQVPVILAVAGGKSKAVAIKSYMEHAPKQTCLITDEGAAEEILKGVTL